jgi:uncharacterized protein (TIGR03083 family)
VPAELLTPAAGLAHVRAGTAALRAVVAGTDLDAAVPTCPGWTLRDLAHHVGTVQRWVCGAIVEGHPNTPEAPGPADRDDLLDWYDAGVAELVDLLARTDPDTPCWAFGPPPRTARFWFRRQAHEHAVHVYDALVAASAAGSPPDLASHLTPHLAPALALDGIDEVVAMFFPRQVRLNRIPPLDRSLALRVEGGARWVLAGDGTEGLTLADAEVAGPVEALYLLLWRRVGLDDPRLTVEGDRSAAEVVLAAAIVP